MTENKNNWIIPALYVGGAFVGWKFVLSPLLETLNLKDTKKEAEGKKAIEETEKAPLNIDFWRPGFYIQQYPKGTNSVILKTQATVKYIATEIYTAMKNDTWPFGASGRSRVYTAFRLLNSKAQISQLSQYFQAVYKQDLYNELKRYLYSESWESYIKNGLPTLLEMINKLPYGFVNTQTGYKI